MWQLCVYLCPPRFIGNHVRNGESPSFTGVLGRKCVHCFCMHLGHPKFVLFSGSTKLQVLLTTSLPPYSGNPTFAISEDELDQLFGWITQWLVTEGPDMQGTKSPGTKSQRASLEEEKDEFFEIGSVAR